MLVSGTSERMGMMIGSTVGEVLELDGGAKDLCLGKFIRIRIHIDILKPLLRVINMVWVKGNDHVTIFPPINTC